MKSTGLSCKSLRAESQYIQNSCHLPPSKNGNTGLCCLFTNLSCLNQFKFSPGHFTQAETVSHPLKMEPTSFLTSSEAKKSLKIQWAHTPPTNITVLTQCQVPAVAGDNFEFCIESSDCTLILFKALNLEKDNELQYCPCYPRPLTLLEQFDHCWSNPPCSELPAGSIEKGLYRPALPADGVFYIWRNRGQLEWLCKVGIADLDPRRRGGKSQGLALFQLRSENLHLSCKVFLWEGKKKGEVFIYKKTKGDRMFLQHFQ